MWYYRFIDHYYTVGDNVNCKWLKVSRAPRACLAKREKEKKKKKKGKKKKKKKKKGKGEKENLPMCRRRCGVCHGGADLRGQSAQVGVLAPGGRRGVRRVRLGGGGLREPHRILHHPNTVDAAPVPGRALHRYRLPAHCHQTTQPESTCQWYYRRRRLSGDQSR